MERRVSRRSAQQGLQLFCAPLPVSNVPNCGCGRIGPIAGPGLTRARDCACPHRTGQSPLKWALLGSPRWSKPVKVRRVPASRAYCWQNCLARRQAPNLDARPALRCMPPNIAAGALPACDCVVAGRMPVRLDGSDRPVSRVAFFIGGKNPFLWCPKNPVAAYALTLLASR